MTNNKRSPAFNNPFAGLRQLVADRLLESAPPPPAKVPLTCPNPPEEAHLFKQAMRGVRGLKKDGGRKVPLKDGPEIIPFLPVDEELEVMAHLAELVTGGETISLSWHKDFVRGSNPKVNPRLLTLLEQGRFPIQDYLDLHGLDKEEALRQVEIFLQRCRARGLRHVLLVHGKGKGSQDGESVLKDTLSRCLCHKRFARRVLAFCNAKSKDGGTGAMYVLLKTWQGPTIFAPRQGMPKTTKTS